MQPMQRFPHDNDPGYHRLVRAWCSGEDDRASAMQQVLRHSWHALLTTRDSGSNSSSPSLIFGPWGSASSGSRLRFLPLLAPAAAESYEWRSFQHTP